MDINPEYLFSNLRHEKSETTHFHHLRPAADPFDARPTDERATKGGATVAYWQPEPGVVLYAVAHCSPRDNYNKKIGRAVAEGRLYSENHVQMYTLPTITEV